jgi:hypothetical protein
MQGVIGEILLDHVAPVAQANDEVVNAMGRVDFHDMPQNRLSPDLYHRLGPERRFLADARAQAPCQNDGFHLLPMNYIWMLELYLGASPVKRVITYSTLAWAV